MNKMIITVLFCTLSILAYGSETGGSGGQSSGGLVISTNSETGGSGTGSDGGGSGILVAEGGNGGQSGNGGSGASGESGGSGISSIDTRAGLFQAIRGRFDLRCLFAYNCDQIADKEGR